MTKRITTVTITPRARRAILTAAKCPACGQRGVVEHTLHGVLTWMCTWCAHHWPAPDLEHL